MSLARSPLSLPSFSLPPSFPFLRTFLSLLTFPFPPSRSLYLLPSLSFSSFSLFSIFYLLFLLFCCCPVPSFSCSRSRKQEGTTRGRLSTSPAPLSLVLPTQSTTTAITTRPVSRSIHRPFVSLPSSTLARSTIPLAFLAPSNKRKL